MTKENISLNRDIIELLRHLNNCLAKGDVRSFVFSIDWGKKHIKMPNNFEDMLNELKNIGEHYLYWEHKFDIDKENGLHIPFDIDETKNTLFYYVIRKWKQYRNAMEKYYDVNLHKEPDTEYLFPRG